MPLNSHQIFNRGRWWPAFQVARFRTTPHCARHTSAGGRPRPNHLGQKEGPKRDRHAACIALYGPMHGTERRVCFCWKPPGRVVTRIAFGRAAYVCGPAYVFQCAVTQHLGIALSALGQGDEFVGDCVFDVIVAVPRAQGDARPFRVPDPEHVWSQGRNNMGR